MAEKDPWAVVSQEPAARAGADDWSVVEEAPATYPGTNEVVREPPGLGQYLRNRLQAGVITPVAGAAKYVADVLAPDISRLSPNVQALASAVFPQRRAGEVLGREAQIAQDLAADYRNVGAGQRPTSIVEALTQPENTARYYGGIAAESTPNILAALATRNPAAANIVASGGTLAQTYGDLRQDPRVNVGQALQESTIAAITEGAGGKPAFEAAMSGLPLGRRILQTVPVEAIGEFGSEAAQTATPALTGREDVPILEIIRAGIDAALVGTGTGTVEAVAGGGRPAPAAAPIDAPVVTNTPWAVVSEEPAPAPAAMPAQPAVAEGAGTPMAAPAGVAPLAPELDIDAILASLPQNVIDQAAALVGGQPAAPAAPTEGVRPNVPPPGALPEQPVAVPPTPAGVAAAVAAPAEVQVAPEGVRPTQAGTQEAPGQEVAGQEGRQEEGPVTYTAADFLPGMGGEVGWSQRGGELQRERREGDDDITNFAGRATGDVTGRTTWVAKADPSGQESRLWRSRPDRSLNEGQAQTALDKAARGEKLRPIEQRFVDHATALAGEYAEIANRESQAYRAELEQYTDADLVAQRQAAREEFGEMADADADEALAIDDLVHRAYSAGAEPEAILDATFDGTPAEQARALWRIVAELESQANAPVAEATERGGAVSPGPSESREAAPARAQAGLFGAPTAREEVDAAARQRDAERDGRTGSGRTDMAAGAGDLFAGRRPAQAMIEEPLEAIDRTQTDTAAFKRWFGDSKVVDENGEPLVVYHGTRSGGFDTFARTDATRSDGFVFTDNRELALTYTPNDNDATPGPRSTKAGIYSAYMAIRNPKVVDWGGSYFQSDDGERTDDAIAKARAEGHDGLIIRNVNDPGGFAALQQKRGKVPAGVDVTGDLYVAFRPEQIKSATANRGMFNPESASILEEVASPRDRLMARRAEREAEREALPLKKVSDPGQRARTVVEDGGEFRVQFEDKSVSPGRYATREDAIAARDEHNARLRGAPSAIEIAIAESDQSKAGGIEDADRNGLRAEVDKVLGRAGASVVYLRGTEGLPESQRRGVQQRSEQRGGKGRTAGLYDPNTKTVYLFTDVLTKPDRAAFVAAHEIAGHAGLRALLGDKLDHALGIARQNPTVKAVADAIAAERKLRGDQTLLATEEALAELAAAVRTGNYSEIETRYGVPVPEGVRANVKAAIGNFLKRLRAMIDDIFGRHVFTDEDVRELLEAAWSAANEGPTIGDAVGGPTLEQTAFHGTPHSVDRFSLQKIGTGEGAQAFGWGLYFAGKRSVAEHYRDRLTESNAPVHTVTIRGERVDPDSPEGHGARLVFHNSKPEMKRLAKEMLADAKAGDAYTVETAKRQGLDPVVYYTRVSDTINGLKKSDVKVHRGRLYEVDIPEDSDLIDNEAPIARQNEKVKEIARQFLVDEGYLREGQTGDRQLASSFKAMGQEKGGMVKGPDGQLLYEVLAKKLGSEQAASQYLNEHGIPGLKYKAGQIIGGRTNEGHNYVVWDESAISDPEEILESVEDMTAKQTATEAAKLPDDATGRSIITGGQLVPFLAAAKQAGADLNGVGAALRNPDAGERARDLVKAIDAILPSLRAPVAAAAPPAPKAEPKPPRPSTGTKNAVTEAERAAAGRDPILRDAVQTNADTLAEAMRTIKEDPDAGPETVEKLVRSGPGGISLADEAVLLVHKTDLRNRRDAAAAKLANPNASEEAKEVARREWESLEAQIATIDEAAVASGREWGRLGQFRQRMLRDDFTFEALERKERARLERPLTPAESKTVKAMADRIAEAQARADAAESQLANAASVSTYDDLVKKMASAMGGKRRPTLERLKQAANESRAALASLESVPSRKGQSGATINPVAFYHLARIGAYHVANGAATFSDWVGKMRADIGDAVDTFRDALPEIFRASKVQADKPLRAGATVAEVLAKIDRANLTPKDVRQLVEAHVGEGMRGEAKVMAAVAEDLGIEVDQARKLFVQTNPRTPQTLSEAKQELRDLRQLVRLGEEIKRLQEGLPRNRANQKVEVSGEVQAKRDELDALRKKLRLGRSEMRQAQKDAETVPVDPEERYQLNRGRDIARRITQLQKRINAGDFAATPRVPKPLNAANDRAQFELAKAKQDFLRHQFEANLAARTPIQKLFGGVKDTLNLARAMMTSLDLSGVLRQGGFITYGHPVRAAKSLVPMLKSFASAEAEHKVNREIENRANAPLYRKYGLELTGIGSGPLSQIEEAYASRWLDRLPRAVGGGLVRGSGRAYTTFLNKLRADSFDAMVASLSQTGTPTPAEGKAIANYINVATGRGKIGAKANAGEALNTVFFAPRLVASRFQLLAGQPLYGGSNRTRGMIAQEYARFLAGVGVTTALAAMALGDDEEEPKDRLKLIGTDPRSSDFGKVKFGNTYLDPLAGLAQATQLIARLTTGETVTQKGDVRPLRANYTLNQLQRALGADIEEHELNEDGSLPFGAGSAADVIGRFLRTKLAPVPGAVVNTLSGENLIGEPVTPGQAATDLITPMSVGNVREVMEEQGITKGSAITLLGLLGMGVQYRKPKEEDEEEEK